MSTFADGGFVVPKFVWDKQQDINEPTQKAIIAYDAGREDLILQVRYEGLAEEFGWLIPVPSVPKAQEASMECFYELSKFTQRKFEFESPVFRSASLGREGAKEEEPPVKVVEVKTVGAYRIAVLSAKETGALKNWLQQNGFFIPEDKAGIIDSYVKQAWYFVAARINLSKMEGFEVISGTPKTGMNAKVQISEKLSSGELHPLHLSFATDKCVFPLKISSINGRPSEVQVYVVSKEPLVEGRIFQQKLAAQFKWRTNMLASLAKSKRQNEAMRAAMMPVRPSDMSQMPGNMPDRPLSMRTAINSEELLPYAQVGRKELPVCAKAISLPDKETWWLTKQTRTFMPEEMRDLEFEPAVAVFSAALTDGEGALAAASLARLGTNGASALLATTQSTNPRVRANAMSAVGNLRFGDYDPTIKAEVLKQLPALFKDSDPEVRLHAIDTALNMGGTRFFDQAFNLLRDDNPEVAGEALGYFRGEREEAAKHVALFKEMLRDTNATVQTAGLRELFNLGVEIPREDLLPLLSVPRMEVAALAYQILDKKGISYEETKLMLQNSLFMVRMIGLKVLGQKTNNESIELAISLLNDPEQIVRVRAHDLLQDLTGQNFPAEAVDQWRQWWNQNKSTFVFDEDQIQQRHMERMRQRRDAIRRSGIPPMSEQ